MQNGARCESRPTAKIYGRIGPTKSKLIWLPYVAFASYYRIWHSFVPFGSKSHKTKKARWTHVHDIK